MNPVQALWNLLEEPKPAQKYSEVLILLDRSGSMSSIQAAVVKGINDFASGIVGDGKGDIRWNLVLFDDYQSAQANKEDFPFTVWENRKGAAPIFHPDEFAPRGGTALIDATCMALQKLKTRVFALPEKERPENVIVVIVTDGQENSSKEWTRNKLRSITAELEADHKWKFIYLGANQDAFSEAGNYFTAGTLSCKGMSPNAQNAFKFEANAEGVSRGIASGAVGICAIFSGAIASGQMGNFGGYKL